MVLYDDVVYYAISYYYIILISIVLGFRVEALGPRLQDEACRTSLATSPKASLSTPTLFEQHLGVYSRQRE